MCRLFRRRYGQQKLSSNGNYTQLGYELETVIVEAADGKITMGYLNIQSRIKQHQKPREWWSCLAQKVYFERSLRNSELNKIVGVFRIWKSSKTQHSDTQKAIMGGSDCHLFSFVKLGEPQSSSTTQLAKQELNGNPSNKILHDATTTSRILYVENPNEWRQWKTRTTVIIYAKTRQTTQQ